VTYRYCLLVMCDMYILLGLTTRVIKWFLKLHTNVFTFFFLSKAKNMTFMFFELLHTFFKDLLLFCLII